MTRDTRETPIPAGLLAAVYPSTERGAVPERTIHDLAMDWIVVHEARRGLAQTVETQSVLG